MEGRELPEGWATATGSDVFELVTSGSRGWAKYYSDDGPMFIRIGNLDHGSIELDLRDVQHVSPPVSSEGKRTRLEPNDILISITAELGMVALVPVGLGEAYVNQHVALARPTSEIDARFLAWYLASESDGKRQLLEAKRGATKVGLGLPDIRNLIIPLAPLDEQRRIAAKLDTTLAAVEACRQRLDGVAAILKRFRQAVLAAATSGELTREWREERGLVWSPRQLTVGDLGAIVTGNTPKAVADDAEEVVPLFKPTELDAGYEVRHAKELMGPKRAQGARMLPPLSVLVTCIGATIGKTGLSRTAGATNQQINAIICNPGIATPQWIYFWFTSPVGHASIVDNASATTLPIINKSRFSALEVEVPDIEEQQEIVQLIESLFTLADQLDAKLTTAIRIVERLTPALLDKAFRGELVPQDPNDEPARVLLERIRVVRKAGDDAGKPSRRGRRKTLVHSELSSLSPTPVPTNDPSRVVLVRTGDVMPQGDRGPNRVSKTKPSDNLKGWSPMQKSLIQILEQHQGWISASTACEEMGISDGSSSDDLELFFRQLKVQVEGGVVDVQRRSDEDWLKLTNRKVA